MTTQTGNLRLILPVQGEFSGTWGDQINAGLTALVDSAIAGYTSISVTSAAQPLTVNNYAADQARSAMLLLTTTTTAAFAVYAPPVPKLYLVNNASGQAATVYCSTVAGNTTAAGAGAVIPAGSVYPIWSDGSNMRLINTATATAATSAATAGTAAALSAASAIPAGTTATTPAALDNSTKLATTAYTDAAVTAGLATIIPPAQIPSLTATVASNALTVTTAAAHLDFRGNTLPDGTTHANVAVPSLSITVPASATLGTVATLPYRLVVLVAYNGGTPVLCITNIAGGLQLDETGFITPTPVSATATSNNVIYSNGAVAANSAYRIVGFIDIVEAVAGTWATAPIQVQGTGGQALMAMSSIGYGQTWQAMQFSNSGLSTYRASGVNYYNVTGKPIMVSVAVPTSGTGGTITAYVNGVWVGEFNNANTSGNGGPCFIVPPGAMYSVNVTSGSIQFWSELR